MKKSQCCQDIKKIERQFMSIKYAKNENKIDNIVHCIVPCRMKWNGISNESK